MFKLTSQIVICLVLLSLSTAGCSLIQQGSVPAVPSKAPQPTLPARSIAGPMELPQAERIDPPASTPTSTPTPIPTATRTATPTPTPALRRLTEGGCCTQPFWSPDSRRVLFIDRPGPDRPAAIWGVTVDQPDARPEVLLDQIAYTSPDYSLLTFTEGERTVIQRRADGKRWTINNGGRRVSFSPDLKLISWQVSPNQGPFNERRTEVWLANLDGTSSRRIITLLGGGLSGWLPDGRLLFSGRRSEKEDDRVLFILSPENGKEIELTRSERLSSISISPDGTWVAFAITFNQDPSRDGTWVVRTDGTGLRKLDFFGRYQWRDDSHLVYVPSRVDPTEGHEFWEVDAATGQTQRLTEARVTRFSIAQGDWALSPDGRKVVFVHSQDRNLWLVELNR